jgi:hypothetical protein
MEVDVDEKVDVVEVEIKENGHIVVAQVSNRYGTAARC